VITKPFLPLSDFAEINDATKLTINLCINLAIDFYINLDTNLDILKIFSAFCQQRLLSLAREMRGFS
jgi:hypothetical protein